MRFIEFCAGIGGMRAGLEASGWQCEYAVDNDVDAVDVHRLAHDDAELADVTKLTAHDLPEVEAWVAGFPCQPFSSSGHRRGFGDRTGNVFQHMIRLMQIHLPPVVILENVEGLLTNKSGHTFASVLAQLLALDYEAHWLLLNLCWFGPPQTRPRLFLIAAQSGTLASDCVGETNGFLPGFVAETSTPFATLTKELRISHQDRSKGAVCEAEERLRPMVGRARLKPPYLFGPMGSAAREEFVSFNISKPARPAKSAQLGPIVAPGFTSPKEIRSIRYWTTDSGRGPTKLYIRDEPVSHCVGTSLGGAPLFAVPLSTVRCQRERSAFLEHSNWHREQDDMLVMRLRPSQAVQLFGPHTESVHKAVASWDAGDTRKYKLVGNMVAPICAKKVAELVDAQRVSGHCPAQQASDPPEI